MIETAQTNLGDYGNLLKYYPHPKQYSFHQMRNKIKIFIGGKRDLAYGTLVYMSNGDKKPIEDIKVGDKVIGWLDGKTFPVKVTDIPFDGENECYEIEFLNGHKVVASGIHEFPGYFTSRHQYEKRWKVVAVKDFGRYSWPQKKLLNGGGLEFNSLSLPFSGLLLGLYLGDGSSSQPLSCIKKNSVKAISFCNSSNEIRNLFIQELLKSFSGINWKIRPSRPDVIYINGIDNAFVQALKSTEVDLWGKTAFDKFIPDIFKRASKQERANIILGLILTDGHISSGRHVITSCNKTLLLDVQDILISLGMPKGHITVREPRGRSPRNVYNLGFSNKIAQKLGFNKNLGYKASPISKALPRNSDLIIKSITPVGVKKTKCITLESNVTRFFVLDGNIVTSNSGKSTATAYEAVWLALGVNPFLPDSPRPPVKIRIVGPDYSTVVDKVNLPMIQSILPEGVAHYWREKRVLEFFNGSEIYFQSYDQEVQKFGGISLHMVIEDEESTMAIHNENLMRLVDTGGRLLMSYTPMSGLTWSYNQIFLNDDLDADGQALVGKVFCKTAENPYVSKKEIALIKKILKDPDEIEAHLEGTYFSKSGLIIKEFDRTKHIVDPRPVITGMVVLGIDPHTRNPEAVVFCEVDSENKIHVFDEIFEEGLVRDTAKKIGAILGGRKPAYSIIDDSSQTPDTITGDSVRKEYAKNGIHTLLAKKGAGSVNEGIEVLREYFRDDRITISRKCGRLISQLNAYMWSDYSARMRDKRNPKEVPMKKDDHLCDCYAEDTEILTDNGWKFFYDLDEQDLVATLNPDTWFLEYQKPTDYIEQEYTGKMLLYDGRTSNFCVTPNHKFYSACQYDFKTTRQKVPNKFTLGTFEIFGVKFPCKKDSYWRGIDQESFTLPSIQLNGNSKKPNSFTQPIVIPMDDWLQFFGLFLAEGYTNLCYGHYRIGISQFKSNVRFQVIKEIIEKMPFNFVYEDSGHRFSCNNKQLYFYLSQFGKSIDRYIPKELLNLSSRQLGLLLHGLMLGDGTYGKSKGQGYFNDKYDSISKRLVDNIQELVLKIGKYGNINILKRNKYMQSSGNMKYYKINGPSYRINFSKRNGFTTINKNKIQEIDYSGYVYCVSVPNQIVCVRRNGRPMWCGNSLRYVVQSRPKHRSIDTIKLPNRVPLSTKTAY